MHARFDRTEEKIVALVNEKFDRQKNKADENYESKMGVENSRESNKLNENKDYKVSSCLLYTSRCV